MKKRPRGGYCHECVYYKKHYFQGYGLCKLSGGTVDSDKPICNPSYNKEKYEHKE